MLLAIKRFCSDVSPKLINIFWFCSKSWTCTPTILQNRFWR